MTRRVTLKMLLPCLLVMPMLSAANTHATLETDWWPMFRHNLAHTGYSTSTAPNTNSIVWSYKTKVSVWSSPAVADGKVYVGSVDFNVYCLDADTGSKIWSYMTGNEVLSSPAVVDGKVYVGSFDGHVYAFGTTTLTRQYRLAITVQPGGSVSYSYAATSGTVSEGSTVVTYVPAGTSILLSAQPSSFLYQFNGWTGATMSSNSQVSLNMDSPMSVESAFGYNYTNIGLIGVIVIATVLAGFLALRRRKP